MVSSISNEECFSFLLTKMLVMLTVEKKFWHLLWYHTHSMFTHTLKVLEFGLKILGEVHKLCLSKNIKYYLKTKGTNCQRPC